MYFYVQLTGKKIDLSFLFGAATYFTHKDMNGESYDSITKAAYWAILTITCAGYGDMFQ